MESGYKILSIILVECNLFRETLVSFDKINENSNIIDITVDCNVNDKLVIVKEVLKFQTIVDNIKQVDISISMVGNFEKFGEFPLSPEEFGKVNGAAIIYPYIREALSNLSLKAGLGNIILPTVNFVKLNEGKKI